MPQQALALPILGLFWADKYEFKCKSIDAVKRDYLWIAAALYKYSSVLKIQKLLCLKEIGSYRDKVHSPSDVWLGQQQVCMLRWHKHC